MIDHLRRALSLLHGPIDPDTLANRDPEFIRAQLPIYRLLYRYYFPATVTGMEHVPETPFLAVGNHNAGIMAYDAGCFLYDFWRRFGPERPLYGLTHDTVFWAFPSPVARYVIRVGAVRASHDSLRRIFDAGASGLVYPGGDIDAIRPFSRRNEVVLGPRRGFIRGALRAGVPVVPVVTQGAHQGFVVLNEGRRTARLLGLQRLFRTEVLPLALGLPWGIFPATLPYIPVPGPIHLRVLAPIDFGLPPEAADDQETVERCFARVHEAMQAALHDLARIHAG